MKHKGLALADPHGRCLDGKRRTRRFKGGGRLPKARLLGNRTVAAGLRQFGFCIQLKSPLYQGSGRFRLGGGKPRGYQCGPAANATPPHTSAPATPQRRATIADSVAAGLYRVLRRRPGGNHLFRRNIPGRRLDRMKRRDVHGADGEDLYLARPHHFAGIGQ